MDEDRNSEAVEQDGPVDPIALIQDALAQSVDDDSLCVGYACVAEWLEADGSNSISVVHTPMPPWHLDGLLSYAREWSTSSHMMPVFEFVDEDDEDDF